jgi:LysM repeat protein
MRIKEIIKEKLLPLLGHIEVLIGLGVVVVVLLGLAAGSLIGTLRRQLAAPTEPPTVTPTEIVMKTTALPSTATPTFAVTPSPAPTEAATVTATPTPAPQAEPAGTSTVHVVESGETLGGIALQYDVTVEALMAENDLAAGDFIQVGQELVIPGGQAEPEAEAPAPTATPAPQGVRTHIVQEGDVLGQIAVQYDVTVEALMEANDLDSPNIYVGQELVIPGGAESE